MNLACIFVWMFGLPCKAHGGEVVMSDDMTPPRLTLESVVADSDGAWLTGSAWDDTFVVEVGWANETTGEGGPAEGTAVWTARVPLVEGENLVSIGARDESNNFGLISFTLERTGEVVVGGE